MDKENTQFFYMLCAAFLYYYRNTNVMTDEEYDKLTKEVYSNKDKITSKFKDIVDWEQLKTSSSLFYIKDYHWYIQKQAEIWLQLHEDYLYENKNTNA